MYTALYLIRYFIPMFHLALHTSTEARSRWRGLLTTFTDFFVFSGPKRALAHIFLRLSGYIPPSDCNALYLSTDTLLASPN